MIETMALTDLASSYGSVDLAQKTEYHQQLQNKANGGSREAVEHMIALGLQWNTELTPVKQNPLHTALQNRDVELVDLLLGIENLAREPNVYGETPLHLACRMNLPEVVDRLLGMGVDVNARDKEEGTPLFHAVYKHSVQCVQQLIKAGCDLNALTNELISPLDQALIGRHKDIVSLLLHAGCVTEKLKGHVYYSYHSSNSFFCSLWDSGDLTNMQLFLDCGYTLRPTEMIALKKTCHQLQVHRLEKDTLEILRNASERPQSLMSLCRLNVRRVLMKRTSQQHTPMDSMIDTLPVPGGIKKFLMVRSDPEPKATGEVNKQTDSMQ